MKNPTIITILCLNFCISLVAQSPGNVPVGLQLWLKADQGTALSGTNVNSWTDQSLNGILGTSDGIIDATFIADGMNFNPTIRFTGSEFYNYGTPISLDIDPSLLAMTIIGVVKTDQAAGGTVIAKGDAINRNFQLHFDATNRVAHNVFGRSITNNAQRIGAFYMRNEPKLSSSIVNLAIVDPLLRLTPYINGISDVSNSNDGVQSGTSNLSDVLIGARRLSINTGSAELFNGDIAEVIVYNRDLTVLELQQVESYLAIKYGITLGANDQTWDIVSSTTTDLTYSGTSTNYFNSLGTIVWNGASNAGYGHNIIGIARDDNAGLLQSKSTSSSIVTESILTIEGESGSLWNDDSYLMIGSNGGATTLTSSGTPTRTTKVFNRMWKVSEVSNETGLNELKFDLSGTTITDAEAAELDLIVADDSSLGDYKNYRGVYNTSTKILTYNFIRLNDGQFFTMAIPDVFSGPFQILFDGVDDLISSNLDLSGLPEVTIMCWVKRANDSELLQTGIIGQNGVFGLSVLNDDLSVLWDGDVVGSLNLTQTGLGNTGGTWHHIATSFNNGTVKMYFDGELVDSYVDTLGNTVLGLATTATFTIGGDITNLLGTDNFEGEIDEVRVFNIALEDEQVQQVVYQEIENSLGNVRGSIIPKDIKDHGLNTNVSWSSLSLYYTMNVVRGNCVVDGSDNALNGTIQGITSNSLWPQSAPMPYVTVSDGPWTTEGTWLHGNVWDVKDLPNKDWSIVEIKNDVTSTNSHTHLGLLIDSGKTLTISGTEALHNTWYLDLNGTIDLQNDSQLIQTEISDLTITSAGKILRRQEGLSNIYRYNYWGSPIGSLSTVANNTDYSMNMLKDASGNIQFVTTYNPPVTSPVTLSSAWFYTFQNGVVYWDWNQETETSSIPAGVGYIHKGPGVGVTEHQYLFEGKPNNGVISIAATDTGGIGSVPAISKTQYLLGNPYPSALDAHKFIDDNAGVSSGTIYLWEQWSGNSHILNEYEGGYAILNKMGNAKAYQFVGIDGAHNGSLDGTKMPTQFLPVGQGFMTEIVADGTIEFNNSQRIFKDEVMGESVFFRGENVTERNRHDEESIENPMKIIRLEFGTDDNLSRELVLGFSNFTSDGFDYGYDSRPTNFNRNDLATILNGEEMAIQAFSDLTDNKEVSLRLNANGNHHYTIKLTAKENIDAAQQILIYDAHENTYFDISNDQVYGFRAAPGMDSERFKLVFRANQSLSDIENSNENVVMYLNSSNRKLFVKGLQGDVEAVVITNMLGQTVSTINEGIEKNTLESGLQIDEFSSGIYLVEAFQKKGGKNM